MPRPSAGYARAYDHGATRSTLITNAEPARRRALCRDVPFTAFATDDLVAEASAELSGLSDFRGPKRDRRVTADTLFRGATRGDLRGPFLSQFLLRDIPTER
jgi:hypothetical protein